MSWRKRSLSKFGGFINHSSWLLFLESWQCGEDQGLAWRLSQPRRLPELPPRPPPGLGVSLAAPLENLSSLLMTPPQQRTNPSLPLHPSGHLLSPSSVPSGHCSGHRLASLSPGSQAHCKVHTWLPSSSPNNGLFGRSGGGLRWQKQQMPRGTAGPR